MDVDEHPSVTEVCRFTPYLDEDLRTRPYGMYAISESPSRYEDLVNILPKTRYVHTESPSRHVKNKDSAQRAPPQTKVFGHPQLLTRKVVYILTTRPSHIYTTLTDAIKLDGNSRPENDS